MDIRLEEETLERIRQYRLPRYGEIPDVGLYLNQAARYINAYLEPFCEMNITEAMISNYVKKKLVAAPKKKQYGRGSLATLIFIALAKSVLSLTNIRCLLELQAQTYDDAVAYDYFCREFEAALQEVFGLREAGERMARAGSGDQGAKEEMPQDADETGLLYRDVIITIARKIHLDHCFLKIEKG